MAAGLAAIAAGWGTVPAQPRRRRLAARGAGERRTARLLDPLERHGWAVLHDLAVPGSRANLDHLVIGPGGVPVVPVRRLPGLLRELRRCRGPERVADLADQARVRFHPAA